MTTEGVLETSRKPTLSEAGPCCRLRVKGGVHDGTEFILRDGIHQVGQEPPSDLCLQVESADHPHSLVLLGGRATLLTNAQDVDRALKMQRLPCQFSIGEVTLSLEAMDQARWSFRWPFSIVAMGLLLGVVTVTGGGDLWEPASHDGESEVSSAPKKDLQALPAEPSDRDRPLNSISSTVSKSSNKATISIKKKEDSSHKMQTNPLDPVQALNQWLQHLEGYEGLTVSVDGDVLNVTGELLQSQQGELRKIQTQYDRQYGHSKVVRWAIDIVEETKVPGLAIESIWLDRRPHIIANGGQRYFEGASLDGGWTVARIEPHQVVLSRFGKDITINIGATLRDREMPPT